MTPSSPKTPTFVLRSIGTLFLILLKQVHRRLFWGGWDMVNRWPLHRLYVPRSFDLTSEGLTFYMDLTMRKMSTEISPIVLTLATWWRWPISDNAWRDFRVGTGIHANTNPTNRVHSSVCVYSTGTCPRVATFLSSVLNRQIFSLALCWEHNYGLLYTCRLPLVVCSLSCSPQVGHAYHSMYYIYSLNYG